MSRAEIENYQLPKNELELAPDDAYDDTCGTVYITLNRLLVFHCANCSARYQDVLLFTQHLLQEHYEDMDSPKATEDAAIYTKTSPRSEKSSSKELNDALPDNTLLEEAINTKAALQAYEQIDVEIERIAETTDYLVTNENLQTAEFDETEDRKHLDTIAELDSIEICEEVELESDSSADAAEPKEEPDTTHSYTQKAEAIEFTFEQHFEAIAEADTEEGLLPLVIETDAQKNRKQAPRPKVARSRQAEPFHCHKCGKICANASRLRQHLTIHTTERKYACNYCNFKFKERSNLNAHLRRHSGMKPHKCTLCEKSFHTGTEMQKHLRTHTGERPYVCASCGATFTSTGGLSEHSKTHNSVRPFSCDQCDKRFHRSAQLRDHQLVHTKERPHICVICFAAFSRHKALKSHEKIHINAREYVCEICAKSFNQRPALSTHIKNCHNMLSKKILGV